MDLDQGGNPTPKINVYRGPTLGWFLQFVSTTLQVQNQSSVTSTPIFVSSVQQIVNINVNGPTTCQLPLASTRGGLPITFKDVGGHFSPTNTFTITATSPDLIDGSLTAVLSVPRAEITVVPLNDGVNSGWFIS